MTLTERPSAYFPMDRRQALFHHTTLPEHVEGAALFADISGFTPLTERLVRELGARRGAEELTNHLNKVYDALITELHRYRGSVITFSGDAITCWLDGDSGLRATACALAMQKAMEQFAAVSTPFGQTVSLAMKTAVAVGTARRLLIGDPDIQFIDVLAGTTLDRLAEAEHLANKGDVVLDPFAVKSLKDQVIIRDWRYHEATNQRFGVVDGLIKIPDSTPWPEIDPGAFDEEIVRTWLLPAVYERLHSGQGEFLAELRPAVALFMRFRGIDYDNDPEAGLKLDTFIRRVQTILSRYGANLTQLTFGDKGSYFSVAFGAPVAHEDDASRAASAALEMNVLVKELGFITTSQIGISQGRMYAGAYGGANRRTYSLMGDDVNMAARLMQAAQSGQILASDSARYATEGFVWENLPDIMVKGKTEPVTIFSLIKSEEHRTIRLQAPKYALPMVGREEELALIEQKIDLALRGKGQIVMVTAEAGMGKSRLIAEVIRMAGERDLLGYGGECQSYGTNTSYLVWQNIWRAFFDLDPAWPLNAQIQSVETQLGWIDPSLVPRAPLLGSVLNLSIPDNELTRSFDAKLRKTSLESLLVDYLRTRVSVTPIFLVLEDTHWIDPLSEELLTAIGRAIVDLPVLLLMAARPLDHQIQTNPLYQADNFIEIPLADFTSQESQRLIELKMAQFFVTEDEVPKELVERVTTRAQGNPFYIEELLNYLRDRNVDPHDNQALAQLDLPTSLYSLILSRIDQLSEGQKSTLKVASVIGRLFRASMLYGVYPQLGAPQKVQKDLDVLSSLDLTPMDTPEPELTYLFKHVVTQEVAYESLPYGTRAIIHDLIGGFIEKNYADNLDQYVDLLAYHYEHSENKEKKREYLLKAGELAQAGYANKVAIDYYRRVTPLLSSFEKISVMRKLGSVLALVGEWQDAEATYRQAMNLADDLGKSLDRAWCQAELAELLRLQGAYSKTSNWLEKARATFEEENNQAGLAFVLRTAGTVASLQNELEKSRELYMESLVIGRQLNDKANISSVLSNLAIVARRQGDPTLAKAFNEEALEIRRELGDKRATGISLNNLGNLALDQGDYVQARAYFEEALDLMRQVGDKWVIANFLDNLGNSARELNDFATARDLYRESLTITHEFGDKWLIAYLLEDISVLATLQSQPERALCLVEAADVLRKEIGSPLSSAEHAKLQEKLKPVYEALDDVEQATAIAKGRSLSLQQVITFALDFPAG